MDAALWGNLPDDLLEQILAWLPIEAFFRTRTLCSRWNELVSCTNFLNVCTRVPPKGPLFAKMIRQGMLTTFFPSSSRWLNIPMESSVASLQPVSAAGGLVAFSNRSEDLNTVILVCNPLTGACKELPPMLFHGRPAMVAMLAGKKNGYRLLVAGRWTTEMFDSSDWSWRRSACLPRGEEVSGNVAFCGGVLYCLTPRWYNCSLLSFNGETGTWAKIKTGRLPGYCQFRNLVELGDGCLAIVGKCVRHQAFTVCVWILDFRTLKWREVGRMPKSIADNFLVMPPSEGFHCSGLAGLVLLTRDNSPDGVLFHAASRSWSRVPHCPGFRTVAFQPRLDAQP